MIPTHERVGIDIGNGICTLTSGKGANIKRVSYRSTYIKVDDATLANYSDATGHYLVGDEVIRIGAPQRKSTDSSFYRSERFRILTCYGLQQLGVKNPAVMIGLPVENFNEIKTGMKDFVRSFEQHKVGFTFNSINFCEQPYGALCYPDYMLDGQPVSLMKADIRLILVDIGDGTTDAVGYFKGRPLDNERAGRSFGVSEIHEAILRHLKEKYAISSEVTTHDIDSHLRNNKLFTCTQNNKEKEIDLKELPVFKKAVQDLISKVVTLIRDTWPSFSKIDYIVFAGGFLELISIDEINKKGIFPVSKCLVPGNPGQSIADGLRTYLNLVCDSQARALKNREDADGKKVAVDNG
jgi:hypothetical protein